MVEQRGSATALSVAGMRAIESEKPEGERLFCDPFANRFAGEDGRRFAAKAREIIPEIIRRVAIRTRFIDDYVKSCFRDGIAQLVIFGAGYDSRAYREGLISYLDEEAVHQLLHFIASFSGAGSSVVLNYTDLEKRGEKFSRLMEQNARGGEPLTFNVNPARMEEMLGRWGFHTIATYSLAELELRYYGENQMEEQAHYFTTAYVAPVRHTTKQ